MGLCTHYYGVLKEGCRKVANITTTLNVAMKSFSMVQTYKWANILG